MKYVLALVLFLQLQTTAAAAEWRIIRLDVIKTNTAGVGEFKYSIDGQKPLLNDKELATFLKTVTNHRSAMDLIITSKAAPPISELVKILKFAEANSQGISILGVVFSSEMHELVPKPLE